ncbi:MAG: hypothetical protein ACKVS8_12290 [Phycisphaerales bacterium]
MESAGPSTRSVRRIGLVLALGCALAAAGVVGFLLVRARSAPGVDPALANATSGITSAPPSVDVAEVGLKNAGRARFQFVDKQDPSRVQGVMEWASLDPQGGGRALVTQPRATIFLSGGRLAHVRAARGRIFTPPRSDQPESGNFEGGVTIALFEPGATGSVDVEHDHPAATLFTPGLDFNLTLGEVVAPDQFRFSTPRIEMAGRALRMVGNQVRQQLELFEVETTDYVRFSAGGDGLTQSTPAADEPLVDRPRPDEAVAAEPGVNRETFYRAVLDSRVRLTRAGLTVSADRLELWAALVNNTLAPSARGARAQGSGGHTPRAAIRQRGALGAPRVVFAAFQHPQAGPGSGIDPRAQEPESLYEAQGQQIEMTWVGPLTVKPLEQRPDELDHDELAIRLTSDETGLVTATDDAAGLRAQCSWLDYGATSRNLVLNGTGPKGVVLSGDGRGRLEVPILAANLGTGAVVVQGPGVLLSASEDRAGRRTPAESAARSRQISWNRQAELSLAVADGWITDRIKDAAFTGKVLAEDARGSLVAGFVKAHFEPEVPRGTDVAAGDGAAAVWLSRLVATDNVAVETDQAASLRAQALDVAFAPSTTGGTPDPVSLAATGDVSARREQWRLDAGVLNATLVRDTDGIGVSAVRAQTDVRLVGNRLSVLADRCEVDVAAERAELWGRQGTGEPETPVSIARDGGAVSGPHMIVDGQQRDLVVNGPGAFRFVRDRAAGGSPAGEDGLGSPLAPALAFRRSQQVRVEATWTTRLHVNEDAGTVEAVGSATAVSSPSSAEVDTLKADCITLAFTPVERAAGGAPGVGAGASRPGDRFDAPSPAASRRRLLRAQAIGSDASPASVDSRRYTESVGNVEDRTLERIVYVEGQRIIASDEASTIEVPGAGKLLIDDRRAGKGRPAARQSVGPIELSASSGTSVFSWSGGLNVDRRSGELSMTEQVRLLHRSAPGDPVTSMDCERLNATIRGAAFGGAGSAGLAAPGQQTELLSARAEGSVVVRAEKAQLVADRLTYDALRQVAEAAANPENRVTFFDPAKPQPVTAARLQWDIPRNKVRVIEPSAVSVPGGARVPGR